MSFKTYHVRQRNIGQTLGQMLKSIYAGKSWGETRRLITSRRVQINGNLCLDEARRLKADEVVRIYEESLGKPAEEKDLNIRFHDEHLLVVEKPSGITTLRHAEEEDWDEKRKSVQPTLAELLQKIIDRDGLNKVPGRGAAATKQDKNFRQKIASHARGHKKRIIVRPVHRLDRDTSGLMIFALSPQAEQALVKLFASHSIDRAYMAVVHGQVKSQTIESDLVRDRGDGLRGSLPHGKKDESSKHAVTHVTLIREIGKDYSLIDCKLETGRTHQIRIHLSEAGHMLCGEKMYIRKLGGENIKDQSNAPRQALHAYRLSFNHPITGKPHTFESKWPGDLYRWLNRLEEQAEETE